MTSNQIALRQAIETERSNRVKEMETQRSNLAKEAESRRSNAANEAISREGNAAKIRSPWGLASLFGERLNYQTDKNQPTERYLQTGDTSQVNQRNEFIARDFLNPVRVIKNVWDRITEPMTKKGSDYHNIYS